MEKLPAAFAVELAFRGRGRPRHTHCLFHCGQVAVPAVRCHQPDSKPAPDLYELAPIGDRRAIRLLHGNRVAAYFYRHIARVLDPDRFQAKVLVSGFAEFTKHQFDRLLSLRPFALRRHQEAVRCEQRRRLIIVSGIESGGEVLREPPDGGLHIQP